MSTPWDPTNVGTWGPNAQQPWDKGWLDALLFGRKNEREAYRTIAQQQNLFSVDAQGNRVPYDLAQGVRDTQPVVGPFGHVWRGPTATLDSGALGLDAQGGYLGNPQQFGPSQWYNPQTGQWGGEQSLTFGNMSQGAQQGALNKAAGAGKWGNNPYPISGTALGLKTAPDNSMQVGSNFLLGMAGALNGTTSTAGVTSPSTYVNPYVARQSVQKRW